MDPLLSHDAKHEADHADGDAGIGNVEYRETAHGNEIDHVAEIEARLAKQPVDEVAQGAASDEGEADRLPALWNFPGIERNTEYETQLDGGKQPGRVSSHGERRARVEQQVEAEPIADHRLRNTRFQRGKHNRFRRLVDHCRKDGNNCHQSHITPTLSFHAFYLSLFTHRFSIPPLVFARTAARLVALTGMKTRLLTVLAICSLGVLSACGADEPAPETPTPVSLNVDAPRVTLTAPGEGATEVIAYRDSGAQQKVTAEFSDGFDQGTGDAGTLDLQPPEHPNVETLTAAIDASVSQDSPRDVTLTVKDPKHSNLAYASDVYSTSGFQLGWTAQSSGRAEQVRLTAPTSSTDQGRAIAELYLMKLLAQPIIFPTDPIAPGATWTVDNRVAGDSTMLRNSNYRLISRTGDIVELEVSISERPAVSALNMGDQGGQGELKVLESNSKGSGRFTVDLSKPLPTAGEFFLATRVTYGEDGKPVRVFQDFGSGIKFS